MRIILLTNDRKTAHAYTDAAEQSRSVRLCTLKKTAQVLELLYRDSFDALLSDDPMILLPLIRTCGVRWPDHTFLLIEKPIETIQLPDFLTFCFSKNSDPKDVLRSVAGFPKSTRRFCNTERKISEFLQQTGVPVSFSGFMYLSIALRIILSQDHTLDVQAINDIYSFISAVAGVSISVTEHAIRTAIDAAWMRADTAMLEKLFGYTVRSDRGAPSNAAFLFRAADHIRLTREGQWNDFGRNACNGGCAEGTVQ